MNSKQQDNQNNEQEKSLKTWDQAIKELKGFIIEEKKKEKEVNKK